MNNVLKKPRSFPISPVDNACTDNPQEAAAILNFSIPSNKFFAKCEVVKPQLEGDKRPAR